MFTKYITYLGNRYRLLSYMGTGPPIFPLILSGRKGSGGLDGKVQDVNQQSAAVISVACSVFKTFEPIFKNQATLHKIQIPGFSLKIVGIIATGPTLCAAIINQS